MTEAREKIVKWCNVMSEKVNTAGIGRRYTFDEPTINYGSAKN